MNRSGSFYSTLANHEQGVNMQKHMRGYDLSSPEHDIENQEKLNKLILKTKFENFIDTYFDYIQYGYIKNKSILVHKGSYGFDLRQIANYISIVNEESLENPDFLNNTDMTKLGSKSVRATVSNGSLKTVRNLNMFYKTGKTLEEPNAIEVNLEYINYEEKTIYKSVIDYNSDGNLIIYDAEKYNYDEFKFIEDENSNKKTIDQSNFKEKSIVNIEKIGVSISYIEKTNDYMQQIFELANLKTDKPTHHR